MSHTPTPWRREGSKFVMAGTKYVAEAFICNRKGEPTMPQLANTDFIVRACNAHDELVAALEQSKEYTAELERRLATALAGWTEFKNTLADLSHAVIEYGRTDIADTADAEWDAVLAADKIARAALAKVKPANGATMTPEQWEQFDLRR